MAAYRASIGGAFGGGAGPATAHPIDYGAIIDSAIGGASTLIGNVYARRRAQAELDLNRQKADQEAQRYADQNRINEQRYTDQNARETERYKAQQKLERMKLRVAAAGTGVTLGPEFDDPSDTPQAAPANLPPIASAMTQPSSTGTVDVQTPVVTPAYTDQGAPAQVAPSVSQAYQAAAPVAQPTSARPTTGYHPENDPRIKRAVEQAKATEQVKINMAPLMASADSAKAVNTARGLAPIHIGEAVAKKAAELPMEIQADSIKEAHKHLDADESTATAQLPDIAHGISILRTLPPQDARAALTARGGFWRNYLNSPQGQQFNQAAKQIALSGALAKEGPRGGQPDRVKMFQDTFVPGAGDSDAVAEQKYAQLQNLVKEVKLKSGRGYERLDPQTKSAIDAVVSGGHAPAPTATAHPIAQKYGITPTAP